MDRLSRRTTIGLAVGFLGAAMFLYFYIQAFAQTMPPPHCSCHSHILTCTPAYEDVISEFGDEFTDRLWTLVHYTESSDRWVAQIKSKIAYVSAVRQSDNFSDGLTYGIDLAIICALDGIELDGVRDLPCGWQPLKLPHDETRYLIGTILHGSKGFSVIAAAAPRMGMPASAVLASKMITSFRPRYLAMVGICAGRIGKVGLGDIIVADPSWDWGSGKIDSVNDQPRFRPRPHQIPLDLDLGNHLKEIARDVELMARVRAAARGRKPPTELRAHVGPVASGAAVVANAAIMETVLDKNGALLGLEMEAYGVATAAQGCGKPRPTAIIMKAVCDFADKDKQDDYQEYAAHTSALFLFESAKLFLK